MEAYFEALGQCENEKVPLRTQLEQCARNFDRALAQQYAPKTVRKHAAIIALFIDFVCWDTDVRRIEEMTRDIANSAFRQWYRRTVGDRTDSELKATIKTFFQCLDQEKGITHEAVLKSVHHEPYQALWSCTWALRIMDRGFAQAVCMV